MATMMSVLDKVEERGIHKGLMQGLMQGRAEGLTQGLTQGREEAFLSAAGRMLAKGFSIEETAEIVGLPRDVLMALKK